MIQNKANPLITRFAREDNCLLVGGHTLTRLAERVGQTPFYVYDRAALSERVNRLRQCLPDSLRLHYAVKANPMPAVVQHMATLVNGFDVASVGEMKTALDTPVPADCISMAGPGKRLNEIRAAIAAGITLNIESAQELRRIVQSGETLGIRPRIAVRINPSFELKASGMKMSGGSKPFGIDEEQVPAVLRTIRDLDLAFLGLHIFAGSQNLKAEAIIETQRHSIALAMRLMQQMPGPLQKLNIGGGFGIPYFPAERALDIAPIVDYLHQAVQQLVQERPETQLILELGRYLVGEAGLYVCRVIERKVSRGQVFLVTDGGLHHHLAASGNLGQVIRKNYPLAIGNRMQSDELETVTVVGPLCTPLDILGAQVTLPRADAGDLVVVYQSGAYGLSSSPAAFLSHPVAEEVLV